MIKTRENKKENKRENKEYLFNAELRALRFILQYPEQISFFRPSLFTHKESRILYDSISYLISNKLSLSLESLSQEANKRESNLQLSTIKALLFLEIPEKFSSFDRDHLIKELEAEETRKEVQNKLERALSLASSSSVASKEYFEELSTLISEAHFSLSSKKNSSLITIEESLDFYIKTLEERAQGIIHSSGDLLLDRALTRKLSGGQIILIAAATGAGKSLYVLNLINGFISLNIPAIYITLEMDLESTEDRLMSLRLDIPLEDWYNPEKILILKKKVEEEKKNFHKDQITSRCRVEIVENPYITLNDINSIITEFRSKHRIDLKETVIVAVDLITQVQDFSEGRHNYSMANNYEIAVNFLNVIAKSQNVCFLATAQLNRDADNIAIDDPSDVSKTRPTLNTVKNSHALAERSRVVLGLWRPKYYLERYLPDDPVTEVTDDVLEVTVLKQSQGPVGQRLNYLFKGNTATIVPLIGGEEDKDFLNEEERKALKAVEF
jgi:replicative DNA helicase